MPFANIDYDKVKPIGNWILVRKCGIGEALDNGLRGCKVGDKCIVFPTDYAERTNFVELIDVGADCKLFTRDLCARYRDDGYGAVARCVESSHYLHCVDHDHFEYWLVKESEWVVDPKTKRKVRRWLLDPCIYED